MPPSGFSQEAINGLLLFVEVNYQRTLNNYQGDTSEKKFLVQSASELEQQVIDIVGTAFPESDQMQQGITGLATFVTECYRDLASEIEKGEDKYQREVIDGKAIQKELDQIRSYLSKFTI